MANEDIEVIRQTLETAINVVATSLSCPVAFENTGFDPETAGAGGTPVDKWLRATLDITAQRPSSVGVNVQTKHEGLFLVDCFIRSQKNAAGPGAVDAMAKAVRAAFKYGQIFTVGQIEIRVRFCERSRGRPDSPWYFVPVTIEWYSYIL